MAKIVNRTFVLNPLAAALAAVLVAPAALAGSFVPTTPGTNQLPGEGKVLVGAGTVGVVATPTAATNPTVVADVAYVAGKGVAANAIELNSAINIVSWGGAGATINSKNAGVGAEIQPGGFNIGSAAQFYMVNKTAAQAAVLNIDVSGATSVIAGKLTGAITAADNPYPNIFVANANGIIVTGTGVITTGPVNAADAAKAVTVPGTPVPAGGLGLLAVDMSGAAAQTAFQTASPVNGTAGTGGLLNLDFANAAPVRIDAGASISGGAGSATNPTAAFVAGFWNGKTPTSALNSVPGGTAFLLLAGADSGSTNGVSNAGTITTNQLAVSAGNAYNSAGFGAQAYFYMAPGNAFVDVPNSATTFANFQGVAETSGAVAGTAVLTPTVATSAFTSAPGSFVNSGTINDLGAWATWSPLANAKIAGSAAGLSPTLKAQTIAIETAGGGAGSATFASSGTSRAYINANGNASNSGLIATGSAVIASPLQVWATGVTNTGTLQTNNLLISFGTGGVNLGGTVTQFSGALSALNRVSNILITPQVLSNVVQQGPVTITAPITVYSDTNTDGAAATRYSVTGNSITLSAAQKVTSLPGNPVTNANGAVLNSSVRNGLITVGSTGSVTAGNVRVGAPAAKMTGFVAPADGANLPALVLNGTIATTANAANTTIADPNLLNPGNTSGFGTAAGNVTFLFNGTSLTGPGSITTASADLYARGNVNNPVSTTDFLQNGLRITAPQVAVSAINTQTQAVNLSLTGNSTLFSGVTITPFANAVLTSGTNQAGLPVPNQGSSLLVQSTGNLTVAGSFWSPVQGNGAGSDALGNPFNAAFYFPGGVVFKSATQVQAGNVMNAWSTAGTQFQGVYFEAPVISSGWLAMNANQFANYSTNPGTPPVTYYMSLGNNGATVNFIPGSHAYRSDDPAATCGAGTGCTSTYSIILAKANADPANWKGIVNVHSFN